MLLSLSCLLWLLLPSAEGAIIVEKFISEWYNLKVKESGKFEVYIGDIYD